MPTNDSRLSRRGTSVVSWGIGFVREISMSDSSASSLATFLSRHSRLFVLTGAGMSTDSGIPDYRDEQGAWKRSPPMRCWWWARR